MGFISALSQGIFNTLFISYNIFNPNTRELQPCELQLWLTSYKVRN